MDNTENASPQPLATPVQELPVQQSPIQPPPTNKKISKPLLFVGLFIVIVISAIAGAVYLLGMQKTSPQQQVEGWKTVMRPKSWTPE
jgi:hypothetical protein